MQFVTTNMQLYGNDDDETPYDFTMDIGYIHPKYQSSTYFSHFKENMLGLAPAKITNETDPDLIKR